MPFLLGPPDTRPKLDSFAPPDDSTKLDVSTKRHGLAPKLSGVESEFLNGAGEFSTPTGVVPSAHHTTHENGGSDEIDVTGLSGLLADPQTAAAHNLLSATHGDTVANGPTRGSLIYGNSTPKWDEMLLGATGSVLCSDGTDAQWSGTLSPMLILPSANVTLQCDDALTATGNAGVFGYILDIASSNTLVLELVGSAFGTSLSFPTAGGEVVTTTGQQTLLSKTLSATGGTGNLLKTVSASSGVAFSDNTTSSKRLRMVLSGAVGNNSFTLANTAARDYKFTDASGNVLTDGNVAVDAAGNVLTASGSVVITA